MQTKFHKPSPSLSNFTVQCECEKPVKTELVRVLTLPSYNPFKDKDHPWGDLEIESSTAVLLNRRTS